MSFVFFSKASLFLKILKKVYFFMKNYSFYQNYKAPGVFIFDSKNKNSVLRTRSVHFLWKFLVNSHKNQANSWVLQLIIKRNVFSIFSIFYYSIFYLCNSTTFLINIFQKITKKMKNTWKGVLNLIKIIKIKQFEHA